MTNATTTNPATDKHVFEAAGLGLAPFFVVRTEELVYQACPGAPIQAGGTCDFCGTCIRYAFWIRSNDKREFKVGCDCVAKTDDSGLISQVKEARRAARQAVRDRLYAETQGQRRKARQEAMARQAAANVREYADVLAQCDEIVAAVERCSEYDRDVATRTAEGLRSGAWREGPTMAVRDALNEASRKLSLPVSAHVGKAGLRLRGLKAVYQGGPRFETMYGVKHMANFLIIEGEFAGAVVVWSTTSGIYTETNGRPSAVQRGDVVKLTGTVKDHGEYKGIKQTFVSRAKLEPV